MIDLKPFTNPKLTPFTLDTFVVRKSILQSVERAAQLFSGTVLDVGCGHMPYREIILSNPAVTKYIGLDLKRNDSYQNKPDLTWDGKTIPLQEGAVRSVMATELFEHCPDPELVMKEMYRVLCPGGVLFFTVPFLWPLHDVPYDQYRYTPFALERHLANAGFHKIQLQPMGGWEESMAQMIGLYARRRPMYASARFLLSLCSFPLIYVLSMSGRKQRVHFDSPEDVLEKFPESSMITGVCGIAYRPQTGMQSSSGSEFTIHNINSARTSDLC